MDCLMGGIWVDGPSWGEMFRSELATRTQVGGELAWLCDSQEAML
jgi:hypothetical protein